eukprot:g1807.t1
MSCGRPNEKWIQSDTYTGCVQELPVTLHPEFAPCQPNYTVSLPHSSKFMTLFVSVKKGENLTVVYTKKSGIIGGGTRQSLAPTACARPSEAGPMWRCEVPVHFADSTNYPDVTVKVGIVKSHKAQSPCTGASAGLPQSECDAWRDIFDAWGGPLWSVETGPLADLAVNVTRDDPCSFGGCGLLGSDAAANANGAYSVLSKLKVLLLNTPDDDCSFARDAGSKSFPVMVGRVPSGLPFSQLQPGGCDLGLTFQLYAGGTGGYSDNGAMLPPGFITGISVAADKAPTSSVPTARPTTCNVSSAQAQACGLGPLADAAERRLRREVDEGPSGSTRHFEHAVGATEATTRWAQGVNDATCNAEQSGKHEAEAATCKAACVTAAPTMAPTLAPTLAPTPAPGSCTGTPCTCHTDCTSCYADGQCYWYPNDETKCQNGNNADGQNGGTSCNNNCASSHCAGCTDESHCSRAGGCAWQADGTPQCMSTPTPPPAPTPTSGAAASAAAGVCCRSKWGTADASSCGNYPYTSTATAHTPKCSNDLSKTCSSASDCGGGAADVRTMSAQEAAGHAQGKADGEAKGEAKGRSEGALIGSLATLGACAAAFLAFSGAKRARARRGAAAASSEYSSGARAPQADNAGTAAAGVEGTNPGASVEDGSALNQL